MTTIYTKYGGTHLSPVQDLFFDVDTGKLSLIHGGQTIEAASGGSLPGSSGTFTLGGAPTDGPTGSFAGEAPSGAILNSVILGAITQYVNTGTLMSPTWTQLMSGDGSGSLVLSGDVVAAGVILGADGAALTDGIITVSATGGPSFTTVDASSVSSASLQASAGTNNSVFIDMHAGQASKPLVINNAADETPMFSVTGSRGGNAALASLLTQLVAMGLIADTTTS